jgi:hypothetical protein
VDHAYNPCCSGGRGRRITVGGQSKQKLETIFKNKVKQQAEAWHKWQNKALGSIPSAINKNQKSNKTHQTTSEKT